MTSAVQARSRRSCIPRAIVRQALQCTAPSAEVSRSRALGPSRPRSPAPYSRAQGARHRSGCSQKGRGNQSCLIISPPAHRSQGLQSCRPRDRWPGGLRCLRGSSCPAQLRPQSAHALPRPPGLPPQQPRRGHRLPPQDSYSKLCRRLSRQELTVNLTARVRDC